MRQQNGGPRRSKSVTLKEVAIRAGVSIATVSRVLNQTDYVSPEVEEAVNRAIKELGYFQNSIARSLKTNATYTIGFVTADISNPYIITVAKAVEDLISARKYNLLMCSTENDRKRERDYLKLLMGRNIDGLVLNGTGFNGDLVETMGKRIPIVLLHRRYDISHFDGDLVDSDNIGGVCELTRHLLSFGHRKIFVIKGDGYTSTGRERFQGFQKAMEGAGIQVGEDYPFQFDGGFTEASGREAVEYLCRLPEKPTALLGLNNMMTIGALKGLRERNISAPEDISVASFNQIDNIELMSTRPSLLNHDPREFGSKIGRALLERLETEGLPGREIIIQAPIVPGNAVSIPSDNLQKRTFR